MKKYYYLFSIILTLSLLPNSIYADSIKVNAPCKEVTTVQNKELEKIYLEIVRVRDYLYAIDINPYDIEEDSKDLYKQLNFCVSNLNSIKSDINFQKGTVKKSKKDSLLICRLYCIVCNLDISIQEQINLIDELLVDSKKNSRMCYSEMMTHIYYYLTAANDMINYVADDYDFKN